MLPMAQLTTQQLFDQAFRLHQAGQLAQAEQIYRQILAAQPNHAEATQYLGILAHQTGRNDVAAELIRRAITLRPGYAEASYNLGIVLRALGRHDQAIAAYRQAIADNPNSAEAYGNLGIELTEKGQWDESIASLGRAVQLNPKAANAYAYLGGALKERGRLQEAVAALERAVGLLPNAAEVHCNLSNVLRECGRHDQAIAAARRAIAINPALAEAHASLGAAFKSNGNLDEAITACRRAIALKGDLVEAHNNLGAALKDKGQFDEAIAAYRQAIAIRPSYATGHNNLGTALKETGQLDGAIAAWRQAIALKSDFVEAHSNLILALHYHWDYDGAAIAQEQRRWNQQLAEPLTRQRPESAHTVGRRLRIGYVSPDFRDHVVGRNLLPLFRRHDREQFEITCYAQAVRGDAMTVEFQNHADRWRAIAGRSDEQVARQIQEDRIDILVDLALHSAHNRLLVFARKPAPVQVTFGGYPAGTGLAAMDFRLSDPHLDPPGMDESIYSERTIRLADSFWCYDPLDNHDIAVNALPAGDAGLITFGCLSNFSKVNDRTLALWANVLRQVENSRLALLAPEGSHRRSTIEALSAAGVDPGRIQFFPRQSRRAYLQLYHRIDIGLDSFPYNGHTTSLDSFWMGVPVVTLVGKTAVARAGWGQLSNLGLTELAGQTPTQFVEIAVALARDLRRLHELRRTLRRRMECSALMDGPKFTASIEAAYCQIWRIFSETP